MLKASGRRRHSRAIRVASPRAISPRTPCRFRACGLPLHHGIRGSTTRLLRLCACSAPDRACAALVAGLGDVAAELLERRITLLCGQKHDYLPGLERRPQFHFLSFRHIRRRGASALQGVENFQHRQSKPQAAHDPVGVPGIRFRKRAKELPQLRRYGNQLPDRPYSLFAVGNQAVERTRLGYR